MKLGFCFLIYDEIEHEDLWHLFFRNANPEHYGIYVHYKTDKPLQYFESCKLNNCVETEYGHVSIVHAHIRLLQKAYEDGCEKMIHLSQSCIPLKSFAHIYAYLSKDEKGHFNVASTYLFPRCNPLLQWYPREAIKKSSNWCILNRTMAEFFVHYDPAKIDREFGSIRSPEEHFFVMHAYLNWANDIIATPNLALATTFANWADMAYKYLSSNELKNYTSVSEEELDYLLQSPSLFGRKFRKECHETLFTIAYLEAITQSPSHT